MDLENITPLILTGNEAPNIERCLAKLAWAKRIVVIDSFSTDGTLEILKNYPAVEVFQRPFDHFADQCNFGLQKITTEWALSLDADYILSDGFVDELRTLQEDAAVAGYRARFKYCIDGCPLRNAILPPRTVLYRRAKGVYRRDGHAHRVSVSGDVKPLGGIIYHDDRKPFSRWYQNQKKYVLLEAQKLLKTAFGELNFNDKVRQLIFFAPTFVLLYCLFLKGLILDGPRGWFYVYQRWLAEELLSLELLRRLFQKRA
jgi:glycosyltransferase involved in cell wall biosynthesis